MTTSGAIYQKQSYFLYNSTLKTGQKFAKAVVPDVVPVPKITLSPRDGASSDLLLIELLGFDVHWHLGEIL